MQTRTTITRRCAECRNPVSASESHCHIHKSGRGQGSASDPRRVAGSKIAKPKGPSSRKIPNDPAVGRTQGRGKPVVLREYQNLMVSDIEDELQKSDRTQGVAACGMGKTVMAQEVIRRHWERTNSSIPYVFVTDKIALTNQSAEAFDRDSVLGEHHALIVHSESEDLKPFHSSNPESQRLAEQEAIRNFMDEDSDRPKVLFVTYESLHRISEIQEESGSHRAPVVIFDEAHRLASDKTISYSKTKVDDPDEVSGSGKIPRVFFDSTEGGIKAEKRVFLTATPVFLDAPVRAKNGGDAVVHGKRLDEKALNDRAKAEDSGKGARKVLITQQDAHLFGNVARHYTQNDAERLGALTPVQKVVVPVSTKISTADRPRYSEARVSPDGSLDPNGMSLNAYSGVDALAVTYMKDKEANNAVIFLPSVDQLSDVDQNWRDVVRNRIGSEATTWTPDQARGIVDDPAQDEDRRERARGRLVLEHAQVLSVHAGSSKEDKDRAFSCFKDTECTCGKPKGGWCACKRVVANCNLFGTGIDIKEIDTVVQMNPNLTNDNNVAQTMGRAGRLLKNQKTDRAKKMSARVIVPMVQTEDGSTSISSILNHGQMQQTLSRWSRLNRDVARSAFEHKVLPEEDNSPLRVLGKIDTTMDAFRKSVFSSRVKEAALYRHGYEALLTRARNAFNGEFKDLPPEERHRLIVKEGKKVRDDRGHNWSGAVAEIAVASSKSFESSGDKVYRDALRTTREVAQRADSIDKGSLSSEEHEVVEAFEQASGNKDAKIGAWMISDEKFLPHVASAFDIDEGLIRDYEAEPTIQRRRAGMSKFRARKAEGRRWSRSS